MATESRSLKVTTLIMVLGLFVFASCKMVPISQPKQEWLPKIFPSIQSCTPNNVYYDDIKHQSFNGLLEKHGYKNPKLTVNYMDKYAIPSEGSAIYPINESFFGTTATEVIIPRKDGGTWEVKVNVPAIQLADQIYKSTKQKIKIYENTKNVWPEPEVAYILNDGKNSIFNCYIMGGED